MVKNTQATVNAIYLGTNNLQAHLLTTALTQYQTIKTNLDNDISSSRSQFARQIWKLRQQVRSHAKKHGLKDARTSLTTQLKQIDDLYQNTVERAEKDCIQLAIEVLTKVIGEQIQDLEVTLVARLKRALANLKTQKTIQILVHPEDYPVLQSHFGKQQTLSTNPSIKRGCAHICLAAGEIEVDWHKHLTSIENYLLLS